MTKSISFSRVSLYCQYIFFVLFILKFKLNTTPVKTTIIIISKQVKPTAQKNHALDDIKMKETFVLNCKIFQGCALYMQNMCCTYSHSFKAKEQLMSSSKQFEQLWQSCWQRQVIWGQSDQQGIELPKTQSLQHSIPASEVRLKQQRLYKAYSDLLFPICWISFVMLIREELKYSSAAVVKEPQIPILDEGLMAIVSLSQQVKFSGSWETTR